MLREGDGVVNVVKIFLSWIYTARVNLMFICLKSIKPRVYYVIRAINIDISEMYEEKRDL